MSSLITCAGEGVGQSRSQKPRRLGQLSALRLGQLAPEKGEAAVLLPAAPDLKQHRAEARQSQPDFNYSPDLIVGHRQ